MISSFTEKDYVKMRKKGAKLFSQENHGKKLELLMRKKWKKIRDFLKFPITNIKRYQIKRLAEIVDYAYLNIPLYRKKYDQVGDKVGSIKSFKDFEKLPILYKEELIDGFPYDITDDINNFYNSTRSSGSSGKFVTLAVSLDAIYEDTIQGVRQYFHQSGNKYTKKDTVLMIYTCPWWIEDINNKYVLKYLPTTTPVDVVTKKIKKFKPTIISTYPTYLKGICQNTGDLSRFGVKLIIVHSEQSTSREREAMSKKLGVPVLDEYSSEELTRIALECPYHVYHLEEDACYIEIVDPHTKQKLRRGKEGVVVGTNLLNLATPIIRYYQGDLAVVGSPCKCKCGYNGRVLKAIHGRYMDSVITPDNKIIPASAFMDIAYNWFLDYNIPVHGLRYLFVQKEKYSLCLYLIKGKYNVDIDKIRISIYSLIPKNMNLKINVCDKLPKFGGIKYRPVINLIKDIK